MLLDPAKPIYVADDGGEYAGWEVADIRKDTGWCRLKNNDGTVTDVGIDLCLSRLTNDPPKPKQTARELLTDTLDPTKNPMPEAYKAYMKASVEGFHAKALLSYLQTILNETKD